MANRLVDDDTPLNIDARVPKEEIAKLVATAERMCFLMNTFRKPHEVRNWMSLNGEALE